VHRDDGSDVDALITAADFGAPLDEADSEATVTELDVVDQLSISRLKDVQWQALMREYDR
jgi:hypothetical protein